jgi:hypothetical protein
MTWCEGGSRSFEDGRARLDQVMLMRCCCGVAVDGGCRGGSRCGWQEEEGASRPASTSPCPHHHPSPAAPRLVPIHTVGVRLGRQRRRAAPNATACDPSRTFNHSRPDPASSTVRRAPGLVPLPAQVTRDYIYSILRGHELERSSSVAMSSSNIKVVCRSVVSPSRPTTPELTRLAVRH